MLEQEFTSRLHACHGDAIRLVGPFVSAKSKAQFTCSQGHIWEAYPTNLIYGAKTGCRTCSMRQLGLQQRISAAAFTHRLRARPGRKCELIGEFVTTKHVSRFRCDNGHEFEVVAGSLLYGDAGCRECARIEHSARITKPQIECEQEIYSAHGGKIRMVGAYQSRTSRTRFECHHSHQWDTSPHNVIVGRGCPGCAKYGYDPTKPGILYYLRVMGLAGETLYKIGITNLLIAQRFKSKGDLERIVILRQWSFADGRDAASAELMLLNQYKHLRYAGPPVLRSDGNTELFVEDVLLLDA